MKTSISSLFWLLSLTAVWAWLFTQFPSTSILIVAPLLLVFVAILTHRFSPLLAAALAYAVSWQTLRYFSAWVPPDENINNLFVLAVSFATTSSIAIDRFVFRGGQTNLRSIILFAMAGAATCWLSLVMPQLINNELADRFLVTPFGLPHANRCSAWIIGIPTGIVLSCVLPLFCHLRKRGITKR